jgi:hypothetical protein
MYIVKVGLEAARSAVLGGGAGICISLLRLYVWVGSYFALMFFKGAVRIPGSFISCVFVLRPLLSKMALCS